MLNEKKLRGAAKLTDEDMLNVSGGVAGYSVENQKIADDYVKNTLGLTNTQFKNMQSAGSVSRQCYLEKMNDQQKAEYARLLGGTMNA